MIVGIILHWWWYKEFVIAEKYRHDNLIIRSHSIVFAVVLAVVVSALVEKILRKHEKVMNAEHTTLANDLDAENSSEFETANIESQYVSNSENHVVFQNSSSLGQTIGDLLTVTGGRPSIDSVIHSVLQSDRPGVYSCGPHSLMESLENAIHGKRPGDCALYREDSEM